MTKYEKPSDAAIVAISIGLFLLFLTIVTAYFLSIQPTYKASVIKGSINKSDILIVQADLFELNSLDY